MNRQAIHELLLEKAGDLRGKHQPLPYERSIFNHANSFHHAGRLCSTPVQVADGIQLAAFPAIVCCAFACELYLKALLTASSKNIRGHHLAELLKQFSEDEIFTICSIYRAELKGEQANMMEDVDRFALAFVDWRYIYEKDELELYVSDLIAFVRSLFFYSCRMYPEWLVKPNLLAELERVFPEEISCMIWLGRGLSIRVRPAPPTSPNVNVRVTFSGLGKD